MTMKRLLFVSLVMCIFCAVNAAGQGVVGVLSAEPQVFEVPSHPAQAAQHEMGLERDLMQSSSTTYDRGEKPLWEVMQEAPATPPTPLGDAARAARKEHAMAKKAVVLWTN